MRRRPQRMSSVAARARAAQAGCRGIEFGEHPGTVGGAVRMERQRPRRGSSRRCWSGVEVDDGRWSRAPHTGELGFDYRCSNLAAGRQSRAPRSCSSRPKSATIKATLAEMRARRHAAQPQGIKTFGSTFKNPEDPGGTWFQSALIARGECRLGCGEAGRNGLTIGGARFPRRSTRTPYREHRERLRRTIAVMAEGRRRVRERSTWTRSPEVQTLGDVRFPW